MTNLIRSIIMPANVKSPKIESIEPQNSQNELNEFFI